MTTNETLSIDGHAREETGKRVRYLRRKGITPANIYGRGMESLSFQVETRELERIVHLGAKSALVNVSIEGKQHSALLRVLQRHPITRLALHAEFFRVELDRVIQTQVPVHVVGEAPAARLPMALVSQVMHEVTVECLPADIPSAIEVDLSPLVEIGDTIMIRDLIVPENTTIISEQDQVVVRAGQARVAVEAALLDAEAAEAAEAAAAEGGVEQPEGAAADSAGDERRDD
jgi:large subunit ribosomal protein L25